LGLALRVGDRDQVGRVVDHDRVVDVVVDDVARRRRNLRRRRHPHRDRPIFGDRQHESDRWRRRRRQVDEVNRRWRQENDWRRGRRSEAKVRIGKHQNGPVDIDDFIRRRRRQAIVDDRETGRRLECRRQISQTPSAIVGMRAARVASQIGPIGLRRVDGSGAPPGNRLTASRDDRAYAPRHRIVRVSCEEVFVAFDRISIECGQVGFARVKVPDGPRSNQCGLLGGNWRRRRIRRALEEVERGLQLRSMPRHLTAIRDLIDSQTDPRKCVIDRQSAFAGNLRKGLRVGRVRAAFVGCDGAGRRVERNQCAGLGLDQREPARQRVS
jgi:hypothetical protein